MNEHEAVRHLGNFVRKMVGDGVDDRESYRDWVGDHEDAMAEMLGYERRSGMLPITALVQVSFHPKWPLVSLNYTHPAHNTLYKFKNGWTKQLEMCRGIIFESNGELIGYPFCKFHNSGEYDKRGDFPEGEFLYASTKYDGDCGIDFHYRGRFRCTTRGTFDYKSAKAAQAILDRLSESKKWSKLPDLKRLTLITEIIHPYTHHIQDYGRQRRLILIGAFNLDSLEDLLYPELEELGRRLGLRVAERWPGESLEELEAYVSDPNTPGEGYVAVIQTPEDKRVRVKFKCAGHVSEMIKEKIAEQGYGYLMGQFVNGSLEEKLLLLDEEYYPKARMMVDELMGVTALRDPRERRTHLYRLAEPTDTYKRKCADFLRALSYASA